MRKVIVIMCATLAIGYIIACGGSTQFPEKLEVSLIAAKGYEGGAKGSVVIDTKSGTDIAINISGLEPGAIYTAFFVNIKSKMFEGIGQEPFVLPIDANGTVSIKSKIKKDVYKRFTKLGIYLNPGKKPIKNPLGVKAKLGALLKKEKPKMVLEGKLR